MATADSSVKTGNVTAPKHIFSDKAQEILHKRFPIDDVNFFATSDFNIDPADVILSEQLARGSYGVVYRGIMQRTQYAVKIEDIVPGVEEQVNILTELTMLQSLPHAHIVKFYGAGYLTKSTSEGKVMIVLELCEHGALRECAKEQLPWPLIVRIAQDIAEGLAFLHEQRIIHRDMKSTNVLIDKHWRAKICDFSFSCHEESTAKNDFIYGTDEFMSPEIAMGEDFGVASDMFCFGIILCELITGIEPSAEFLHRQAKNLFALDENELKEAVLEDCPESLEALALQCCDLDPQKRPTARDCIDWLQALLDEMNCTEEDFEPIGKLGSASGAFVSPVREGTVTYPKTELFSARSGMRGVASAGRGSRMRIIPADVDARLAYLEVQVQELRAENKLLGRELTSLSDEVTRLHEGKAVLGSSLQSSETMQTAAQRRRRSSFRVSLDNDERISPPVHGMEDDPPTPILRDRTAEQKMSPASPECDDKYAAMSNEVAELRNMIEQLQAMLINQAKPHSPAPLHNSSDTAHSNLSRVEHKEISEETHDHQAELAPVVGIAKDTPIGDASVVPRQEDTTTPHRTHSQRQRKDTSTAPSLVTIDPAPGITTSPVTTPVTPQSPVKSSPRPPPIITTQTSSFDFGSSRSANADLSTAMESFLDVINKCSEATHQTQGILTSMDRDMSNVGNAASSITYNTAAYYASSRKTPTTQSPSRVALTTSTTKINTPSRPPVPQFIESTRESKASPYHIPVHQGFLSVQQLSETTNGKSTPKKQTKKGSTTPQRQHSDDDSSFAEKLMGLPSNGSGEEYEEMQAALTPTHMAARTPASASNTWRDVNTPASHQKSLRRMGSTVLSRYHSPGRGVDPDAAAIKEFFRPSPGHVSLFQKEDAHSPSKRTPGGGRGMRPHIIRTNVETSPHKEQPLGSAINYSTSSGTSKYVQKSHSDGPVPLSQLVSSKADRGPQPIGNVIAVKFCNDNCRSC